MEVLSKSLFFLLLVFSAVSSVTLKPPQIISRLPKHHLLLEGPIHRFVLECTVQVRSDITWYKNGHVLQPAKDDLQLQVSDHGLSSLLEFPRPSALHEGFYHCEATNALGRALSPSVHVAPEFPAPAPNTAPPTFSHAPESEIAKAGSRVVLRCEADGRPTPDIRWTKNGALLSGELGPSLVIPSLRQQDVANYACNASNSAGYEYKNVIVNILTEAAKIVKRPPQELLASRGSNVVLDCVAEGHPRPRIIWTKDDRELGDSSKFLVSQETGSLTLKNSSLQDEGKYVCTATNHRTHSVATQLVVKSVTTIVDGPRDRTEVVFTTVKMNCSVVADLSQSLTVLWKKNNVDLGQVGFPRSERIETDENYGLSISNLSFADSGTYTCVASTPTSTATDSGLLRVVGVAPSLDSDLPPEETLEGGTVLLPCHVTAGFPAPQVTWFKDGVELVPSGRLKTTSLGLAVEQLLPSDSGEYICRAQNSEGVATRRLQLRVRMRTRVVSAPTVQQWQEGGEAVFHCQVEVDQKLASSLQVTWYKGDTRLDLSDPANSRISLLSNSSLRIDRMQVSDLGVYTCRASTALEPSLRSEASSLYIAAPFPWLLFAILSVTAFVILFALCLSLRLRGRFTKDQGYYGVADMERKGGVRELEGGGRDTGGRGGGKEGGGDSVYTSVAEKVAAVDTGSLGSLISDELCLTEGQQEDGSFRQGYIC